MGLLLSSSTIRLIPRLLKAFRLVILNHIHLLIITKTYDDDDENGNDQPPEEEDRRPYPYSSVPVPGVLDYPNLTRSVAAQYSMDKHLPVMPFYVFLNEDQEEETKMIDDCVCIVCMDCIEKSHVVRVACNCCHVFHKECLDGWIGQGQTTCPLCRSNLFPVLLMPDAVGEVPVQRQHHHQQQLQDLDAGDPWRVERMIYLFGEDYLF